MTTPTTSAMLAYRIATQRHSWCVAISPDHGPTDVAAALAEQLQFELESDEEEPGTCHRLTALSSLPDNVHAIPPGDAVVISGLDELNDAVLSHIDLERNRMVPGPSVVLVIPASSLPRLHKRLPNIWGLVGSEVWSLLGSEERLDVPARLAQLKEETGLAGDEVLQMAANGALPPDPQFIEWLILLGRGDLIGE